MKRWMLLLLVAVMTSWNMPVVAKLPRTGASAQRMNALSQGNHSNAELYEELVVGSTTAMTGKFFTGLWGNNTADIDVRKLLHGYSPVKWSSDAGGYVIDQSVVSGSVSQTAADGSKQFIVALSEDLAYSDGSAITARDYVFSLLLSVSPEIATLGGVIAKNFYIAGARDYALRNTNVLRGVRLLDDYLFSVTIDVAYLPHFYELSFLDFTPCPISVIAPGCKIVDDGNGVMIQNQDVSSAPPIFSAELLERTLLDPKTGYMSNPTFVSGPYVLTEYNPSSHSARFALNPYYKGDDEGRKPTIERLTYTLVSPDTMIRQLQQGEIDLLHKCTQATAIKAGMNLPKEAVVSKSYPRDGFSFISFNCTAGPAQFESVRRAIMLSMDRHRFITDYVGEFGVPVNGYYGMGQWMPSVINNGISPVGMDHIEASRLKLLSMDVLDVYRFDPNAAKALLIEDGWVLNASGEAFDEKKDDVRARYVNEQLMLLDMVLVIAEKNAASDLLNISLAQNLHKIGVKLTIETLPFDQLLSRYYRQHSCDSDMFYLASNFETPFNPMYAYSTEAEFHSVFNTTGVQDEPLAQLARELSNIEPGNVYRYCKKWLEFQQRWNEILPAIPLYSNLYFDFHTTRLRDYNIESHITWADAIKYAYLSDEMTPSH